MPLATISAASSSAYNELAKSSEESAIYCK